MDRSQAHTGRERVWIALAELFLDTEGRHLHPRIALTCVRSGYRGQRLRDTWRQEVTPAFILNLWCVAGEWEGWPDSFVLERVGRARSRRWNRPGWIGTLLHHLRWMGPGTTGRSLERYAELIASVPDPVRDELTDDLTRISEVYFDMGEGEALPPRLEPLYRAIRAPLLAPLGVSREERRLSELRAEAQLAYLPSSLACHFARSSASRSGCIP